MKTKQSWPLGALAREEKDYQAIYNVLIGHIEPKILPKHHLAQSVSALWPSMFLETDLV